DKVRKHHGDLAALGTIFGLRLLLLLSGLLRNQGFATKLPHGRQHYAAMPQEDADLLQVLISQMGKRGNINSVFSKALRVLGHPELFEPVRKVLHCAAPSATVVRSSVLRYPTDAPT